MRASWVRDPTGTVRLWRAASTPAMKVDDTAPSPGVSTPRRPVAGAMARGSGMATIYGRVGLALLERHGRRLTATLGDSTGACAVDAGLDFRYGLESLM